MLRSISCLFVMLMLLTPCRAEENKPAEQAISNTRHASCVIEITNAGDVDRSFLNIVTQPNDDTRRVIHVSDETFHSLVTLRDPIRINDGWRFSLEVDLTGPDADKVPPKAKEMLETIVDQLRAYYQRMRNRRGDQLAQEQTLLVNAERLQEADIDRLRQQLHDLASNHPQSAMPPQELRGIMLDLDAQQRQLRIAQISDQARRDAIAAAIARLRRQSEESVENDPVLVELKKVESLRSAALDRNRQLLEAGQISSDQTNEAETALAEVRARMAERRQSARQQAGGELIDELNRELVMLGISDTEQQAKLDFVSRQLNRYQQDQDVAEQFADLSERLDQARKAMQALAAERAQQDIARERQLLDLPQVQVIEQHAE